MTVLDVMSPVTDGVEATRLNVFQPSACSGGPIHIAPSRSVSCHNMMRWCWKCLQTPFGRDGARWSLSSSWRTTVVHAFLPTQWRPPRAPLVHCTGRGFLAISSPLPLRAQACDPQAGQLDFSVPLSRIARITFCEGPNITFEWLGPRGRLGRPMTVSHHGPHPASSARRSQLVPCHERCHHEESAPSSSPPTASASAIMRQAPNPALDAPPWYGDLLQLLPFPGSGHL